MPGQRMRYLLTFGALQRNLPLPGLSLLAAAISDSRRCAAPARSCIYALKLLPDGRLLSADHTGWVRSWQAEQGGSSAAAATGLWPRLQLGAAFAPSLEDPASALVDVEVSDGCWARRTCWAPAGCCFEASPTGLAQRPSLTATAPPCRRPQSGALAPVGMHCLDACLTHLAVAGRDSVVRLYSYESGSAGGGAGGGEPGAAA